MKKLITIAALLTFTTSAFAGSNRVLDGTEITVGSPANVLTLPATTDTLVGRATTDTLTNKTMDGGSNTFTNIPLSALAGGAVIGVSAGGTGNSSLNQNGLLFGNGTAPMGATPAGTQYQVFQAGAAGAPTVGAVALDQSAAVSGLLSTANGGTGSSALAAHSVVVGADAGPLAVAAPSSAGYVLTSNGPSADPSFKPTPTSMPSLNGGSGAAQVVAAAGGVVLTNLMYENYAWVTGSGGAVNVSATPSVTACTADGQKLHIAGTNASATVTLQDSSGLAGSGVALNGNWVGALNSVLNLHCDMTQGLWVEDSRS